jgi:hypothetical protein
LIELIRTNDAVAISFIEALFRDREIDHMVLDQHMSVLEGSLGVLPRRIMVVEDQENAARHLIRAAGMERYLKDNDSRN